MSDDDDREKPEDEGDDADTVPAAPGDSDTPLGDTDQHSDAPSPPAQSG
jgi:hypothetical protein